MSRDLRALLIGGFGAIAALFLVTVVWSQYADYRAASEVSGWLSEVEAAQKAIAESAIRSGSLAGAGDGVELPKFGYAPPNYSRVGSDGTIILGGGSEGQVVVLVPTLKDGEVTWDCVAGSRDSVMPRCRR